MRRRLTVFAAGVAAVLAAWVPAASATVGVGVGANALQPTTGDTVNAGQTVALDPLLIVDTGTEPISVTVTVQRLAGGASITVPAAWLQLPTAPITLTAKQRTTTPVTVAVPVDAASGKYVTDLIATGYDTGSSGQLRVHAAAAAVVEFTVDGTGPHQRSSSGYFNTGHVIAIAVLAALIVAGLVALVVNRRRRA